MSSLNIEVMLAAGYAVFLVLVAGILETVARHVHHRAQKSSRLGFTYHRDLDAWKCPRGQYLHRESGEQALRILRYRAPAHHCNKCAIKFRCTDSDTGRVLEHRADSWLDSGLRQFHRAVSLSLLLLAIMILVVEILRRPGFREEIVLAGFVFCIGMAGLRLLQTLHSPDRSERESSKALTIQ